MDDQSYTPRKRTYKPKSNNKLTPITDSRWFGIDLRNQGILNLAKGLFFNTFIYELNLENNKIVTIPSQIVKLKNLQVLNISHNRIKILPPELGKLIYLKEIHANSNYVTVLPTELGFLFNIESFHLDDNPLVEPFKSLYKRSGGRALILFCKENHTSYPSPLERQWNNAINVPAYKKNQIVYHSEENFVFSIGTYNFLANVCANEDYYGYVPSWVLRWDLRREKIIEEIIGYSLDILCAQEVETQSFINYFRNELEHRCDYDSLFYPKTRAKSMANNYSQVDGCATFWKRHRFNLAEQKCVEFTQVIMADKRFNENMEVINRNISKDNIALITVLKNRDTSIIVANLHVFWDPEYKDVKLMQTIVLIEEIMRLKNKYPQAGILIVGDFNTLQVSETYKMLVSGSLKPFSEEFKGFNYNPFTVDGFTHNLNLKDAYKGNKQEDIIEESDETLTLTNYTANFKGVIDYIFHNDVIDCISTLSGIDESYIESVVGFPTMHLPSDHILIAGKFNYRLDKFKNETEKNKNKV